VAKAVVTDEVDHRSHEMSRLWRLLPKKKIKKKSGKKMTAGQAGKMRSCVGKKEKTTLARNFLVDVESCLRT
jgi:hypothetical protein